MKHFWPLALQARTPFHLLVAPLYSISTVTSKCSNGTSKRLHVHGLLSMYIWEHPWKTFRPSITKSHHIGAFVVGHVADL